MSASHAPEVSLRLGRLDTNRLAWAFALSIAAHLLFWGTYSVGKRYHVWERLHLPAWIQKLTLPRFAKPVQPAKPVETEPPLVFVEVNPAQALTEAPKNATHYSDKNAVAANPDADANSVIPKITGTQEHVPKTEDTERNRFDKLMPALPDKAAEEEIKPKPTKPVGDLVMAKPQEEKKSRPRTIKEALAQKQMSGQKMKQPGGVLNRANASFDVKATGFGAYDAAFIAAVKQRWEDLLDSVSYDGYRQGKVSVEFKLNYDGRITEMKVSDNTVTETLSLLCQKAILDPAPFERWPNEMRVMIGADYRKITFTFYYN
ncbi:MAG: hypothetical protein EPO07_02200 [Verrucomicrobia bacterium]|nr:MAG: hypothetical protein EPO07_02200 [Verrucomicrobiota bacterium]